MSALFALVAAAWSRPQYVSRVAAVVRRYEQLLVLAAPNAPQNRGRLTASLIVEHPGALGELERTPSEALAQHLVAARVEHSALRQGATLPASPELDKRVRVLALADLTWLVQELRVVRRLARGAANPEALAASYAAQGRKDPLPDATAELLQAAAAIRGGEVRRRVTALLALRHGRPDLSSLMWPHEAHEEGGSVRVGRSDEILEGRSKRIEAYGRTVAVFRHRDRLFALDDTCPHRGGPLGKGDIDETGAVHCPLHAWAFDLETGAYRDNPNLCVRTYVVEERDGVVVLLGARVV